MSARSNFFSAADLRDGHDNGENVNAWMIAHGYGAPYDGGKKTPFAGAD